MSRESDDFWDEGSSNGPQPLKINKSEIQCNYILLSIGPILGYLEVSSLNGNHWHGQILVFFNKR